MKSERRAQKLIGLHTFREFVAQKKKRKKRQPEIAIILAKLICASTQRTKDSNWNFITFLAHNVHNFKEKKKQQIR